MKAVLPALTGRGYEHLAIQEGDMASLEFLRVTFADVPEADLRKVSGQDLVDLTLVQSRKQPGIELQVLSQQDRNVFAVTLGFGGVLLGIADEYAMLIYFSCRQGGKDLGTITGEVSCSKVNEQIRIPG